MEKSEVIKLLSGDSYYTIDDLRYNQKVGIMLSKEQFAKVLTVKDELVAEELAGTCALPLVTFNSKHCFFVRGKYLLSLEDEYLRLLVEDYEANKSLLFARNAADMAISRLFSEIEGSLKIENVPTTRKRIAEIHKSNQPKDQNDIIIKNMLSAVEFITEEKPAFNKENLKKLYDILSKDSLDEALRLKEGCYWRDGEVFVGSYEGADYRIVDACMDSLFAFAGDAANIKEYGILLPYICQYYIVYIHPYFDFNGRTARMVSFWLSYIYDIAGAPIFMSEAINDSKGDYYRAIVNTRNTNNDLTYFLGYILETAIKYTFVYKNLEEIKKELSESGDTLTATEWGYVKKILVHNRENFFNYKMFLEYIHSEMSKQGAIKILDNLTAYGILTKSKNRKGEAIYRVVPERMTYQYHP